jgi:hypothetical protein
VSLPVLGCLVALPRPSLSCFQSSLTRCVRFHLEVACRVCIGCRRGCARAARLVMSEARGPIGLWTGRLSSFFFLVKCLRRGVWRAIGSLCFHPSVACSCSSRGLVVVVTTVAWSRFGTVGSESDSSSWKSGNAYEYVRVI